jgi:hypothetical protein
MSGCVLVLFLARTGWTCVGSSFTLTWWIILSVDCQGSRVCVLFICSLLLLWPWHTRPGYFVTHPLHCLAVAWLATTLICWNLSPCGCSVLVCLCLSCAIQEFGQAQVCSDSVHCPNWISVICANCPNWNLLTLTFWSSTCHLFCRFEMNYGQKIILKSLSLGFSLEQTCNFLFLFLFIISQFLYQEYCKDFVICVYINKAQVLFMSFWFYVMFIFLIKYCI